MICNFYNFKISHKRLFSEVLKLLKIQTFFKILKNIKDILKKGSLKYFSVQHILYKIISYNRSANIIKK